MSGISGMLAVVAGAWLATDLPFDGWAGTIIVTTLMLVGILLLIRGWSVYRLRQDDRCSTCRGAGTVYSAEWNDWRATGPVHTIRELCPACEGAPISSAL